MAKLVDNEPQYEGEKKVWNLFGSKLPSNWVVYNNRSVNGREYDICVIAPEIGMFIVEVKGWSPSGVLTVKTIEILSKYKNVIVLFNYQPDYKNVYQTWLNIYSWFESKINLSNQNFNNDSQEFEGGIVADNMAAMIAGSTAAIDLSKRIEVTEFDNQTEFAGYVAKKFENASHKRENDEFRHPALYYMDEQIYAANSGVKDEFPWPLDIAFFEVAQAPVDWKYQVYVTSRLEYKNFRRYALVYGLGFSKSKIKLSYIKNENDEENELYYLLRVLNANIRPYVPDEVNNYRKDATYIKVDAPKYKVFTQYDLMKYRLCKYRFLLDSIIQEKSVYKDQFLMRMYLTIVLEDRAKRYFSGKPWKIVRL